jgi:bifunctional UDP-N-acetylglucosamine pyrophosphorylase/glucosamine-1-phosphate N-acetyltransferase
MPNDALTTAVILAAGQGTRLRPLTDATPKPMLLVAGRPILEWTLSVLPPEIMRVILVVGYRKEQVMEHFGSRWNDRDIVYVEQHELNGTGGAVHACREHLSGRFLVMNGDDLYAAEDVARVAQHDYALLGMSTEDAGRFGVIVKDDAGRIVGIAEGVVSTEKRPGIINIGVYAMDDRFFDYTLVPLGSKGEFGLPQTLASMTKDIPLTIVPATFWHPIGYPEDIATANRLLAERRPL